MGIQETHAADPLYDILSSVYGKVLEFRAEAYKENINVNKKGTCCFNFQATRSLSMYR